MDDMPGRFPPPSESGAPGGPPSWGPPPEPQGWQPSPRGFYPLTIGRVFELTFSLYRFRWRTLVGLSLLIQVPVSVIAATGALLSPQDPDFSQFRDMPAQQVLDAVWASVIPSAVVSIVLTVLIGMVGFVGAGALVDAIGKTYSGSPTNALESARRAIGRLATYAGLFVLIFLAEVAILVVGSLLAGLVILLATVGTQSAGLAIFLGLIVFVATFAALFFVLIRWSMAVQAVALESAGARSALGRSWRLVAGSGWRVIGYVVGYGLLVGVIGGVLVAFAAVFVNPYTFEAFRVVAVDPVRLVVVTFIGGFVSATLQPIPTIATTLLYLDLRFRQGEQPPQPGEAVRAEVTD